MEGNEPVGEGLDYSRAPRIDLFCANTLLSDCGPWLAEVEVEIMLPNVSLIVKEEVFEMGGKRNWCDGCGE